MAVTDQLDKLIREVLEETGFKALADKEINFEHPANADFGDYSTNLAMVLYTHVEETKSPRELAQKIAEKISESIKEPKYNFVSKVEVAGPGFINFYLSDVWLIERMIKVLKKKSLKLDDSEWTDKRVVVEYTDPNPFKEFHIGHLYSNVVGESIAKILDGVGAKVWRADFFGDVGMHVAKSIWGLLHKFEKDQISITDLAKRDLKARVEYMGQAYALGATAYKEGDDQVKEEIRQINFLAFKAAQQVVLPKFKEKPQVDYDKFIKKSKYTYEQIKDIYAQGRAWSMAYFEEIYARLGTKFDGYYPESRTGEYGYGMVMQGLKDGIFEKGEGGAIIYPGKKHGLHNRVFINALGLPTYETKDFGNAVAKNKDFPYDKSIVVTGNEINEYFEVVIQALTKTHPELGEKTYHIGHGMVRLPEGKMSSRTGKILRGEWLLEEAKKRVLTILEKSRPEMDQQTRNQVAEKVGQAAIKYTFLKSSIGGNISFSFEESLSFSGNSGPYLQYTYVRCVSVLEKAGGNGTNLLDTLLNSKKQFDYVPNMEEKDVLRNIYQYYETIKKTSTEFAPHYLCTYLYELAQSFNSFYGKHKIATASSEEEKAFRLALVKTVAKLLKDGLGLLGVATVTNM